MTHGTTMRAMVVAGLLAVGLTACSTGAPATGPAPASAPPGAAVSTAGTPPTTAPPTTAPAQPAGSGELPRCTTGELSATLGTGDAAAGSVYRPLVFTNTGEHPCELRGFPGVSYVTGDDGHQVGPAADMSGERGPRVPIAPGRTARAQLQLVDVRNFDAAACAPTPVRGLRIYPPGDTGALFVPMEGTGCAATPPGPQLTVQTVTP